MIVYLTETDVRVLYDRHVHAGPLIKPDLLSSAVALPQAAMFGSEAFPDIYEKAAALLRSLAENQPYQDGNKRIAWLAMRVFLRANEITVTMSAEDAVKLMLDLAQKKIDVPAIAGRLREAGRS